MAELNETVTTIVGNVITDVKQRCTTEGVRVASFRVASNSRRYDKSAEQWVDGDRLYVSVTCWRRLARGVGASLMKGDPVVVTGRLYTRGYEVEGQKRSVTEIEAVAVGPDLSRCLVDLDRTRRGVGEDAAGPEAPERLESPGDGPSATPDSRPPVAASGSAEPAAQDPTELLRVGVS